MNTPMTEVASSGAELPAAINVAPATSGFILNTASKRHLTLLLLICSVYFFIQNCNNRS